MKKRNAASGLLFLALLVLPVAVELALRLFDPIIGLSYYSEAARYFSSMQSHDRYAYIHPPHDKSSFQNADVMTNAHGLRGPEFEKAKPPGKFRILILGDSVVFGWGVRQEDIFAYQLQRLLNQRLPALNAEVIPAGAGSWNTRTEYEYFKSEGIEFQPDVLVLLVTSNDMELKRLNGEGVQKQFFGGPGRLELQGTDRENRESFWRAGVKRFYLLKAIAHYSKINRLQKARSSNAPLESLPEWEDARLALDGIVRLCRENSTELVPYLFGTASGARNDRVLRLYQNYFQALGVRPRTLPDRMFDKVREYTNSLVDSHPNAKGHALIAREMAQDLEVVLRDL